MTGALTAHPGPVAAFLHFTGTAEFCITRPPPSLASSSTQEFFQNL